MKLKLLIQAFKRADETPLSLSAEPAWNLPVLSLSPNKSTTYLSLLFLVQIKVHHLYQIA